MVGFTHWRHLVGFETRQRTVFDVAHGAPVLGGLFLANQAGHFGYFRHDTLVNYRDLYHSPVGWCQDVDEGQKSEDSRRLKNRRILQRKWYLVLSGEECGRLLGKFFGPSTELRLSSLEVCQHFDGAL